MQKDGFINGIKSASASEACNLFNNSLIISFFESYNNYIDKGNYLLKVIYFSFRSDRRCVADCVGRPYSRSLIKSQRQNLLYCFCVPKVCFSNWPVVCSFQKPNCLYYRWNLNTMKYCEEKKHLQCLTSILINIKF